MTAEPARDPVATGIHSVMGAVARPPRACDGRRNAAVRLFHASRRNAIPAGLAAAFLVYAETA